MEELLGRIKNRNFTVGIIGLGYVGLPLLFAFHKGGFNVVGFDIDSSKIKSIENGKSYIKQYSDEAVGEIAKSDRVKVTQDYSLIKETDAIIVCVPTPLNKNREPDMRYVVETSQSISKYLKIGQFVSLESTTWPGTTRELMIPILEKGAGLKAGKDFYVCYSPEREDPGNTNFDTSTIPKILGAICSDSLKIGKELYGSIINSIVPVSSPEVAESSKLLENIFRSVNIALVNEMKVILDSMNIDIHEVIEAAATKPFGFMKFTPGPGLGGHCIPVDPFYLSWKAREFGLNTRFIELAGEVNELMPEYVVDKIVKALNTKKKSVNGSKALILGVAYKPDVDDLRESPAFVVMDKLVKLGADIEYHDTWIPTIPATREHKNWEGKESILWTKEIVSSFDVVAIITNHSDINYIELKKWSDCIVDSRNAIRSSLNSKQNHIFKA